MTDKLTGNPDIVNYGMGEPNFVVTYYACRDEMDGASQPGTTLTYSTGERDKLAEVLDRIVEEMEELRAEDFDARMNKLEDRLSKIEQALIKLIK